MDIRRLLGTLLDLFFPPKCRVCECPSPDVLCAACCENLERLAGPICHRCGEPFDARTHHGNLCAECRGDRHFDRIRSACGFTGLCRRAIHRLKYHGRTELASPLGAVLVEQIEATMPTVETTDPYYTQPPRLPLDEVDVIVPVPLSSERMGERGFNQSELLARRLSEKLNAPMLTGALLRIRDTRPQVELSGKERYRNVRGAFSVANSDRIRDRTFLLVDDVLTTGATMSECARTLKRSGAMAVYGTTLARQSLVASRRESGGISKKGAATP